MLLNNFTNMSIERRVSGLCLPRLWTTTSEHILDLFQGLLARLGVAEESLYSSSDAKHAEDDIDPPTSR